MEGNLSLYDKVREVPETAKRKITGGRMSGKTDINPMWRIKSLIEQFGPCGIGWYYKTVRKWMEQHEQETAAFVDIELFVKVGGEWSMPIAGTGGSMFAEKEKSGIHVSDECYKMATTDAISVACKQLGIGADVYWEKDRGKYVPSQEDERLKDVIRELTRTGYSQNAICNTYKIKSIYDMSDLQIKNFMEKIKSVPDRQETC